MVVIVGLWQVFECFRHKKLFEGNISNEKCFMNYSHEHCLY
jgi:hypothetical protein